jgi:hypothetical protein
VIFAEKDNARVNIMSSNFS